MNWKIGQTQWKIVKIYFYAFVTGRSESFAVRIDILLDIYYAFPHSIFRAHDINCAKGQRE